MKRNTNTQQVNLTTGKRGRPALSDAQRQRMRNDIAQATLRLFQDEGYRTISMRRIAREVGCSPMTLYQYYGSKLDILHTLWNAVFEELFSGLAGLDIQAQPPRKQLEMLATAYASYWVDNPEHYRLVYMTEGVSQSDVSVFIDDPDLMTRYQVFADVFGIVCADAFPPAVVAQKLDTLLCFLQGIIHNRVTISGYSWPDLNEMVGLALHGVLDA
ncbi:hypothetical protein GCM10008090_24410 [Arenicella chitinivorans]|uniref:HTH tetR-type domain-containing protein n=1 Tax=Arenicella chitinivorans TaxID=1329800 RepID=A0A918RWI9_9GAMM|nr:TetR/AcrR family transcriptional regulator [Arenicella chitinivorans]GHA13778.1 hypothetical protein GCM10008090_24410 [Arenicella chitinivorans]